MKRYLKYGIAALAVILCAGLVFTLASNHARAWTSYHIPYVQNVTKTSAVVLWQTSTLSDSKVEYGLTTSYGSSVYASTPLTTTHEMALTGLTPGTVYHYRTVYDDGSGPVYSADSTFKTVPSSTSTFSFVVITDSHKTPDQTKIVLPQVINGIFSLGTPALVLHAGDVTDDGTEASWDTYFFGTDSAMMMPLASKVAIFPVIGNHDSNRWTYFQYFALPSGGGTYNEQWYSFNYGNAHFINLDDNVTISSSSAEGTWLANDLAATTADWIFITSHDSPLLGNSYVHDLGIQYGVKVMFCGHDHFYDRSYKDGIYQITAATAGGDPWNARSTRYSQFTLSTSGFVSVDIDGTTATIKGRYPGGTVFDSVVVTTGGGPTPTPTNTPSGPTPTNTPVPPTNTPTNTPVPPTATNTPSGPTPTNTPVPPTNTSTPVPPTNTPTPTATPGGGGSTIFYDNFEDNSMSDWASSTGGTAQIRNGSPYEGSYSAGAKQNGWFSHTVSTAGKTDVHLKYAGLTIGFDAGEYIRVEWYDGSAWQLVEQLASEGSYTVRDWDLPAGADNNANFAIRFTTVANGNTEWGQVDIIEVTGQ
jgi:predicted phosphodiesterase